MPTSFGETIWAVKFELFYPSAVSMFGN